MSLLLATIAFFAGLYYIFIDRNLDIAIVLFVIANYLLCLGIHRVLYNILTADESKIVEGLKELMKEDK